MNRNLPLPNTETLNMWKWLKDHGRISEVEIKLAVWAGYGSVAHILSVIERIPEPDEIVRAAHRTLVEGVFLNLVPLMTQQDWACLQQFNEYVPQ